MKKDVVVLAAATTISTIVAAVLLVRQWKRRSEQRWRHAQRILRKFARECATPIPKLWQIADDLVAQMQSGLNSTQSTLQMLPSCLPSLPNGYYTFESKFNSTYIFLQCKFNSP